jgi:hypothetical protein
VLADVLILSDGDLDLGCAVGSVALAYNRERLRAGLEAILQLGDAFVHLTKKCLVAARSFLPALHGESPYAKLRYETSNVR